MRKGRKGDCPFSSGEGIIPAMANERCPGQDQRYWKPEDIQSVLCPGCAQEVEIWKDEPLRACPSCGREIRNPKLDPSCAEWCPKAGGCRGSGDAGAGGGGPFSPGA